MFRYRVTDDATEAQWTAQGPLTPAAIETEAAMLWQARAEARARRAHGDICDGLSYRLTALAYLALKTDFGDDAATTSAHEQAECVADYLRHWGEQLRIDDLVIGLYGSTTISLSAQDLSFVYRITYRPHYLGSDHFDVQLIDDHGQQSRHPNPVTQTGYRSVFASYAEIEQIGCPRAWITVYLRRCAAQWQPPDGARQLSLLDMI